MDVSMSIVAYYSLISLISAFKDLFHIDAGQFRMLQFMYIAFV